MLQEFTQEIENTAREVANEIHTALPGKIVSFEAEKGIVSVKPYGKYVTLDEKELDYPIISDVPLVFPMCQSSKTGIAFPVKPGESCLVIISEVELDAWRSGAESESSLRYDLSSAIAIPGLLSDGGGLLSDACNEDSVVVGMEDTKVFLSKEHIQLSIGENTVIEVLESNVKMDIGQNTILEASDSGIVIGGDLNVKGSITYTGSLSAG